MFLFVEYIVEQEEYDRWFGLVIDINFWKVYGLFEISLFYWNWKLFTKSTIDNSKS